MGEAVGTSDGATRQYFVDEAGDLSLFDKTGRSLLSQPGVSKTFMLGLAMITDPARIERDLVQLRADLLRDPYFRGVPSMQPEAGKTALYFHAKDDLPEVRREVFRTLMHHETRVQIVIRRKNSLEAQARNHLEMHGRKLSDATIYSSLVKILFKNLLHQASENIVTFARRGKSNRQQALEQAITHAKRSFERSWNKRIDRPTRVLTAVPSTAIGLQVIDYYLWALQRMFERGEDRFFELLRAHYRLIVVLDDRRDSPAGRWYSRKKPLIKNEVMPVAG